MVLSRALIAWEEKDAGQAKMELFCTVVQDLLAARKLGLAARKLGHKPAESSEVMSKTLFNRRD